MAATYKNYDQAKAAYDGLVAAKDRALRDNEIQRAQTLKAIDRRILQNGVTGGHQETTDLKARSAASSNAINIGMKYDPEIASLYAQMKALQQPISAGGGSGGSGSSGGASAIDTTASRITGTAQRYPTPSSIRYGAGADGSEAVNGFYIGPQKRQSAIRF